MATGTAERVEGAKRADAVYLADLRAIADRADGVADNANRALMRVLPLLGDDHEAAMVMRMGLRYLVGRAEAAHDDWAKAKCRAMRA